MATVRIVVIVVGGVFEGMVMLLSEMLLCVPTMGGRRNHLLARDRLQLIVGQLSVVTTDLPLVARTWFDQFSLYSRTC